MLPKAPATAISPEVQELLAPVRHYVEGTVNRLARKSFKADPIVEAKYSRVTSIVSSAYKRHGSILERALVAALTAAPHLLVWAEPHFGSRRRRSGSLTLTRLRWVPNCRMEEKDRRAPYRSISSFITELPCASALMKVNAALAITTLERSDRCCAIFAACTCFFAPMVFSSMGWRFVNPPLI